MKKKEWKNVQLKENSPWGSCKKKSVFFFFFFFFFSFCSCDSQASAMMTMLVAALLALCVGVTKSQTCEDQYFVMNQQLSTASLVPSNTLIQGQLCVGTGDFFRASVTNAAPGFVVITFNTTSQWQPDLDEFVLTVTNADSATALALPSLFNSQKYPAFPDNSVNLTLQTVVVHPAGTHEYRTGIANFWSGSFKYPYGLTIAYSPSVPPAFLATAASPKLLLPGIAAFAATTDTAVFAIDVNANDELVVGFAARVNVTVTVKGAGLNHVIGNATSLLGVDISQPTTMAGRVNIEVTNASPSLFNVISVFAKANRKCDPGADGITDSDSPTSPRVITLGQPATAAICRYTDIDYFRVAVPRPMALRIQFSPAQAVGLSFAVSAKALITNETVFSRSFSADGSESTLVVNTGVLLQVIVRAPTTPTTAPPGGRFTLLVTEDVCPFSAVAGYPAFLQRSTAVPIDRTSLSTGFCTNQTAGEHWFVGEVYEPGWIFYLGTLSSSMLPANQSITVSLPDIAGAPSWTVNTTSSLRRQSFVGTTVGKVYVRVQRAIHTGAPPLAYSIDFGFYACNATALPPTSALATLELGKPQAVRTCVTPTSGAAVSSPEKMLFTPSAPGIFTLRVVSQRAASTAVSVQVLANTTYLTLNDQYVTAGNRLNASGFVSLTGPTNLTFSSVISSLGELSVVINTVGCGETSNLFSPEVLNASSWLVATTIAGANAKRNEFQALEQSGGYVRGVFCTTPDVHYYALGVRNGSIVVQWSSVEELSSSSTLGSVYLVSSAGAALGTKSIFYSSSSAITLTQAAAQTDNIFLAIESTAPFAYVLSVVVSGCNVADEANMRVLALDQRVTANWCPVNDQDSFTLTLPSSGLYNVTLDFPLPLSTTVYVSTQLYSDATRTMLIMSTSCSMRNNGLATRSCQFALSAGNVTFTIYASSHIVYGYGVKVTRVGACAVDAQPPPTSLAAALAAAALVPAVERSATFCPSASASHFFALPTLTPTQTTMTFTFNSDSAPSASSSDPLWRIDAALLDTQQRVVARIGSLPSATTLPPIALPATARVLRVQRVNHTLPLTPPQTYSFNFNLFECITDADDGTGDSLQFARLLPLGDTNRLFSICPPNDVDYFRFAVSAGAYVLRVGDKVPLSEPSRFTVRVYDGSAELLTETRASSQGIEKAFLALGGDVVVSVQSSRQSDYDITLVRSTVQCLSASAPEEASTATTPLELAYLNPYQVSARTLTFCSMRGPSTHFLSVRRFFSDVSFRLVTNETEGTLTLSFTLPNGTMVTTPANAPVQTAGDAFSTVSTNVPVVFQVTRTNPRSAVQAYRIVLSSYECGIDALDNGGPATLLVPGVLSNLTVCRNTQDRFRFELTDFEQVTIRTTPATLNLNLYFRDDGALSGKLIGTGTGSVSADNAPIGSYVVDVSDPSYVKTLIYSIEAVVSKPRAPSPTPTRRLIVSQAPTPLPVAPTPPTTPLPAGQTPTTTAGPQCGNRAREGDEVCDGESCCAADCKSFKSATTECRPAQASAECDLPELCDGVSALCPTAERVRDTAFVCRASLGACSDVTKCDGVSTRCPAVKLLAVGSPCTDSDPMCTSDDKCDASGQCVGRFTCDCRSAADPTKACDDKNDCTVDTCDSGGMCVNTRAAAATKCTPAPAVLMAAMVCDAMPTFQCTAEGVCANAADAAAGNSSTATCPGEPACSGRGLCCAGRCRCPPAFTGLDCGKELAGPDSNPNAKPVVVTFADQKESLSGIGTDTARVRLADGSALVLRASGGTVTMGDEAIGVTGSGGDADQIEFPETLTVSLDGRAFRLRGIIFSDFSADRSDVATVSLAGAAARRRAALEPLNITVADWRAPEDLAPVTSFTIAPAMGGDGFGVLSLDLLDVSNGSVVGGTTAPGGDVSAAPRGVEDGGLDAETLMYIYIGVGAGVGLICCILLVVLVVCLVKRRNNNNKEAHSQQVPLAQYHSEGQLSDLPQAPVSVSGTQTVGVYASVRDVQTASSEMRPSQYCTVPASQSEPSRDSYGTLSMAPAPAGASASQYLSPGEAGMYLAPDAPQAQASQYLPVTMSQREMSSQEYVRPPAVGTYSQM
jgi:hypothetical protein